ncbi:hypothetical protein PsorP6_009944 [Peronosclerospora sorghi]|uniref:Uncharacterized protein n=1 Tax=Peronosclerospora sorghi TaxID=230839 RepID=A0ACC0VYC9_9STRA|nr:hypothetical protein PsorP6_009944 [Peronosclerospora sorghi]
MQQVAQNNRNKRQQVVNKHRKGIASQEVKIKGNEVNSKTTPAVLNGRRGAGRRGRGGRGGRGGRVGTNSKPPTGEDLVMEIDQYWHEAGKGLDPKAAQLNRQMTPFGALVFDWVFVLAPMLLSSPILSVLSAVFSDEFACHPFPFAVLVSTLRRRLRCSLMCRTAGDSSFYARSSDFTTFIVLLVSSLANFLHFHALDLPC